MKSRKTDKYREKEKRGEGRKENYTTWIRGHEFSSSGKFSRISSWLCENVMQLMSNLELYFFFYLIWDENVIEIREQYPLRPIEQTKLYAALLGYKHPKEKGKDKVMTTDFVVTKKDAKGNISEVAYAIKPSSERNKKRIKEKIEIEEMYWKKQNIEFEVIDETKINEIFCINMSIIYQNYYWDEQSGLPAEEIRELTKNFKQILQETEFDTRMAMECMAQYCGWEIGEVTNFIYYLITHREIKVNLMSQRMNIRDMKIEFSEGE